MASKKYMLILGILCLSIASFGQRTDAVTYWGDSTKITTKDMPQYNEFMNNQYPYPAKPRSMWELGLSVGPSFVLGDVATKLGYAGGISVRKALSHVLSLRFGYTGSFSYGLDYRRRTGAVADGTTGANPWAAYGGSGFVANYRNATHELYGDLVVSLNSASHYRGNPKTNWYVLGGYSLISADVDINARNGSGLNSYASVNFGGPRGDIRDALKNGMDDTYENNAPVDNGNRTAIGRMSNNQLLRHALNFGGGVAFKFSDKFNLGLEQRFITAFDDDLDGIRAGRSNDVYSQTTVRLNFNMGSAASRVQPLWWINPNNYIYNELNAPKHMKLPTPVLPDADGDGVTDQFDLEPNTPQGAPVDSHGVSKDTDGDGVPDYKDKELLTQQKCFPVNADGVGNCPEPDCCKELRDKLNSGEIGGRRNGDCGIGNLPSVTFKSGTTTLSSEGQAMLNDVAQRINANPNCNIRVIGYGAADKRAQQLSWDRVNAVIKYLVEKQGISEGRLIFSYGQDGDSNTVDLQGTTEQGPNTVPAPHPNLRRGK